MKKRIKVWDLPTRLFHWGLLAAVFYSWLSVEILEDMQQHFYAGYVVLTLLLFRISWGLVGSRYSRFRAFFFPVSEIMAYIKGITQTSNKPYLGHNPLGSLSALAIIFVLLSQASLGLFSTDDYFFGPLAGLVSRDTMAWLSSLHLDNVNVIYALLGLHVLAIIYYKLRKKEPLTKAMLTGYKATDCKQQEHSQMKPASNLLALVILTLCAAVVYFLATAFADQLPSSSYDYY